ncbi:MAG: carbon starvation protein A, partial [Ignavibacteriae bacterium]|nr:carbon starvation protein A [Ignavibacteriota bacterium]
MHALPLILIALCVMAIAYRYYSAFIAAKVLTLDDTRVTPAHTFNDGQNYQPTNKWVLFGHHFAAISGAGPLIGPVLAAQFGFLPGFLWLIVGVVIAGAVHDFTVLVSSVRQDGKSLAAIARKEISPLAGLISSIAILIILVIALAGLGIAVVNALSESSWGTFTIAMTIPIALVVGLWMYRIRPGKITEASIMGVLMVVAAVVGGSYVPGSAIAPWFTLSRDGIVLSLIIYGFIASVLPIWLLLIPRDYLSSYMKIGTIGALILGVIIVNPELKMPAFTQFIGGGGPIIPGKLFPFLFVTIACGAISGFHALISIRDDTEADQQGAIPASSGTGRCSWRLVGIVALIAACSLEPGDYFAINLSPEKFAALGMSPVHLETLSREVGETVAGRPGGAVSLAVGFAYIFTGLPGLEKLMGFWYHFAIMFE